MDSVPALGRPATRELSATGSDLRNPLSLETSRQCHSDGSSACYAYAEIARLDESTTSSRIERNHWIEWAADLDAILADVLQTTT